MTDPNYLSIRSASLYLDGISETTLREAVASGALPAARFGTLPKPGHPDRRSIRIRREDLAAWVDSLIGGAA